MFQWHHQLKTCLSFQHQTGTGLLCQISGVWRLHKETQTLCSDHLQIKLQPSILHSICMNGTHMMISKNNKNNNNNSGNNTKTTVLWPFVQDYLGELVPE